MNTFRFLFLASTMCVTLAASDAAYAQAAPTPSAEELLGTVEVDGSAGLNLPPLPKLAIVPLPSLTLESSQLSLVVRRDLELSGQFQVLDANSSPPGPFMRERPLDLGAFAEKGAEYIVQTYVDTKPTGMVLVAEAFLPPKPGTPNSGAAPTPVYRKEIDTAPTRVRASAHKLVDELLGGLTGRLGGFASKLTYAARIGNWRKAYVLDADGFGLQGQGPDTSMVLSPSFGPEGRLFYALSRNYSPFRLATGANGAMLDIALPGSMLGLTFSPDADRMLMTIMTNGRSSLWAGENGLFKALDAAPNANHPAIGPSGHIAYAGGDKIQRIYVDGRPVSPPGLMASAPVFCDTAEGLLVLFSVQVAGGTDLVSMDTKGQSLRRLTQRRGANSYPACSPDGRMVAFFSNNPGKEGSGLFVAPVARPWLAKRISAEMGESLQWARAGANR